MALILLAISFAAGVRAQELEPRAYRVLPTGLNFIVGSYQFSTGNIVFDATAPVEGLEVETHVVSLSYLRTFGLAGRGASVSFTAPRVYAAEGSARLGGEPVSASRRGWADARARLVVNLLGGPALSPVEFASFRARRALGVGLTVSLPTGQYDSQRIVNFGANRWGFKPEIGYSSVRGRWIFETALGVWLFTENGDGPEGMTVRQDPILSWQGHIDYEFPGRVWLALDLNFFHGGAVSVGEQEATRLQANSRAGVTLSVPFGKRHSVKLAGAVGAYTRAGADFDMATLAYQYRWGR
jgi:hypothetical protein